MVNGARPDQLSKPAAVASAPLQSPLVLPRQRTSMYSACSAETPVFVYGKAATPIAGEWSAEPWTPSQLRPARLADMLSAPGAHGDNDAESVEEHFDEADAETVHDDVASTVEPTESALHGGQTTKTHVAFVYRHDPYALTQIRREVFRCECDQCVDGATLGHDGLALYTAPAHPPRLHPGMSSTTSNEYFESYGSYEAAAYGAYAPTEAARDESVVPPSPHAHTTPFVPPPPPPKITRGVFAESAESSLDVDAAFYHIAMRWYAKVVKVQHRFVPLDDPCPVPEHENQTFIEWIEAVGRWWLRHFEHAQVKTSASSGLLRSAIAPPHARFPATTGFETHASLAASYAAHRLALKSGPRRQRGESGLTAQMLESHLATLPTPRSLRQPEAPQDTSELPW